MHDGAPPAIRPADYAHGDLWPAAGVHAGGHIYAAGRRSTAEAGPRVRTTPTAARAARRRARHRAAIGRRVADAAARPPVLQAPYPGEFPRPRHARRTRPAAAAVVVASAGAQPLSLTGWRPRRRSRLSSRWSCSETRASWPGRPRSPEGVGMSRRAHRHRDADGADADQHARVTGRWLTSTVAAARLTGGPAAAWRDQPSAGCAVAQRSVPVATYGQLARHGARRRSRPAGPAVPGSPQPGEPLRAGIRPLPRRSAPVMSSSAESR